MSAELGLVSSGQVNRSLLGRVSRLNERLGPVVAPSQRLATRVVNALRAGQPVRGYDALADVRTVLVCVPDALVDECVAAMHAAKVTWLGKIAVLCGGSLDSASLKPLAARGAATGSFTAVEGIEDAPFVAEGMRQALREIRTLVRNGGVRVHELREGRKPLHQAGIFLGTTLFAPLLDASVQCFREAGLKPGPAASTAEQVFQRTLRAYLHAGKKARGTRLVPGDRTAVQHQIDALQRVNPALSRYFSRMLATALEAAS